MPINGAEVLAIVNKMHADKNVNKELIFQGIEAALKVAIERATGLEEDEVSNVAVSIDRLTGHIAAKKGEEEVDPGMLGRIPAQSAKYRTYRAAPPIVTRRVPPISGSDGKAPALPAVSIAALGSSDWLAIACDFMPSRSYPPA